MILKKRRKFKWRRDIPFIAWYLQYVNRVRQTKSISGTLTATYVYAKPASATVKVPNGICEHPDDALGTLIFSVVDQNGNNQTKVLALLEADDTISIGDGKPTLWTIVTNTLTAAGITFTVTPTTQSLASGSVSFKFNNL